MIEYATLSQNASVFQSLTGLRPAEFEHLLDDMLPRLAEAERQRLARPTRLRTPGAGCKAELSLSDQTLLAVLWLRQHPIHEVLAYLFGVSDSTVSRVLARLLPLLEASGRDTMRMPDPGRKRRKRLDTLLAETPELAVVIDTFEQRVQRPRERRTADGYYSGKKKQHTLKSQIAVDAESGTVCDVAESVPGPRADLTVLKASGLMERLPSAVGALGDLAYVGITALHPQGLAATPRRKPRGKERPPEDVAFNRAFATRRMVVEHTIGGMRRFRSLSEMDRNHRQNHTARVRAVAGLVNRQLRARFAA
jgi:hypothetical protein